jgi:4-hydroxy-tetrahydrodipicolinate synthase
MHADGSIDWNALENLLEWHLLEGTDAIVIAGTTGESAVLSGSEYQQLLEVSVTCIAGRCAVLAGCGGPATTAVINNARIAMQAGANGALIVTPYYNRPPQSGLVAHYRAISDACDFPLVLYNVPGRTGVDLQPDSVARLYRRDNIVALKEANPLAGRMTELVERFSDQLVLLSGDDPSALESLRAGASGVISVVNNLIPAAFSQMVKLALAGDQQGAHTLDQSFQPLYAAAALSSNPIPVKWALYKLGKIDSGIRLPLLPLDKSMRAELDTALQTLKTL